MLTGLSSPANSGIMDAMARRRLIAGIAFAGLGLGLFLGPAQGFSQNKPDARAETPRPLRRTRPTPAPKRRRP